jgi:ribosomal protein L11 methyltransferase
MNYYLFTTKTPEEAEKELIKQGLQDVYQMEDSETGEFFIGGRSPKPFSKLKYSKLVEKTGATVDWEEQWALFAENFFEGNAHIDLSRFGKEKTLLLSAGPGFGDLSHPTTALMLEMMRGKVKGESILDIGTGSGILTLAALLLEASSAIGLDIDPAALKHARLNAKTNHLQARFVKKLPKKLPPSNICLLNMIFPEQKIALRPIKRYNQLAKIWITSGILLKQKEEYLTWTKSHNWQLEEFLQKDEWLGFIFSVKK